MYKELALKTIQALPDNVDLLEIIETLYLKAKAEDSMKEVKEGNYTSHEDLKKEIREW